MIAPWFYAGPYVPSGVLYGRGLPSQSVWLVPGYERWIDEISAINVYSGPVWWQNKRENGRPTKIVAKNPSQPSVLDITEELAAMFNAYEANRDKK